MATVHLPSGLTQHTGGVDEISIDAPRVRELLIALAERFPGLADQLERMAVAIDGHIYHDAPYHKLTATSEVYLVPRIAGGARLGRDAR
jgi:molybdopterin converting factor small subunit